MHSPVQSRDNPSEASSSERLTILLVVAGRHPAPCGVVDYADRLAEQFAGLGHRAVIASISGSLKPGTLTWPSSASKANLPTHLEIQGRDFSHSCEQLREMIAALKPDVVSLQFFPYGFARRGWLLPNIRPLARSLQRTPLHINFHEIWTDTSFRTGFMIRIKELFRCAEIALLGRLARPKWVHTTCERYRKSLSRVGIRASTLPVPSTIAPAPLPTGFRIQNVMADPNWPTDLVLSDHFNIGVVFGRVYPDWNFIPLLQKLVRHAAASSRRLLVLSIGAAGFGNAGWNRLQSFAGENAIENVQLGVLPEATISHILQVADFGLSPTPCSLSTKSSSNAAMTRHGLNVFFAENRPSDNAVPQNYVFMDQPWPDLKTARPTISPKDEHATAALLLRDFAATGKTARSAKTPRVKRSLAA